MGGVVITRDHSWRGPDALQNKMAEWVPWWAITIGWYSWHLIRDPYRAAGVFTTLNLLIASVPFLVALSFGVAIPVLASVGAWWALIQPPKGVVRPTGIRELWTSGRAWIAEIRTLSSQASALSHGWASAAVAVQLTDGQRVPELEAVTKTENGFTAEVACGQVQVPATALLGQEETLAAAIDCREVIITPRRGNPGRADLEFVWGDAIGDPFGLDQLPLPPPGRLCAGLMSPDGQPLTLAMLKSILIAGIPGSGKSNEVQVLLASARMAGIPHNLFLVDSPGGVELAELSNAPMTVEYAEKVEDAERVLQAAARLMWERAKRMAGVTREMVPTLAEPLCPVIVDEFLLHYVLLAKGTKSPLGALASNGRKYGFPLWGLTQDPTVETMGAVRRLFVQKLVFATENDSMTNAAFGDKRAESDGALCHLLDEETQAGMGYARVEGLRGYRKWRGPYVSSEDRALIAAGRLPEGVSRVDGSQILRDWLLYYFYWPDGTVAYIGKTNEGFRRLVEHMDKATKADLFRTVGVTWRLEASFDTEDQVLDAERDAIRVWKPTKNIVHNRAVRGSA